MITWVCCHQIGKPFRILTKHKMMGWQWHPLDHMQITCTSLRADTIPVLYYSIFYRPNALHYGKKVCRNPICFNLCQPKGPKHRRLRWVLICLSWLINIRFTLQGWGHRSTKLFHNLQQSLNLNQQLIVKTACVYMCVHIRHVSAHIWHAQLSHTIQHVTVLIILPLNSDSQHYSNVVNCRGGFY